MQWYFGAIIVTATAYLVYKQIIEEKLEPIIRNPLNKTDLLEPFLDKVYIFVKEDGNFMDVMEEIGTTTLSMTQGNCIESKLHLTKDNGVYCLHRIFPYSSQKLSFRIGEQFEETTLHEHKVKSVITQRRNNLTHTQFGDVTVVIVRSFTSESLLVEYVVDKTHRTVLRYESNDIF
ncbi:fatty acid-binding protein 9-like [Homalodisca vitripennis]|uniref:fatty acid-binding protein 9-like n=1 Tax=Homalodisca vitripennis TaxID=197043 RepID=UPI001EEA9D31|nr:fatty acid-binding protein 9-like [Homalodisca vitripennis]KAG8260476.1 regulation of retrograde trans-synaptic signaling by endocanabinoid [Homalodisca vitripennis]